MNTPNTGSTMEYGVGGGLCKHACMTPAGKAFCFNC